MILRGASPSRSMQLTGMHFRHREIAPDQHPCEKVVATRAVAELVHRYMARGVAGKVSARPALKSEV